MESNKVTTLILKDAEAGCSDKEKADSEAMFIDPITRNGYMIQKVRERNDARSPIIFKVVENGKYIRALYSTNIRLICYTRIT